MTVKLLDMHIYAFVHKSVLNPKQTFVHLASDWWLDQIIYFFFSFLEYNLDLNGIS